MTSLTDLGLDEAVTRAAVVHVDDLGMAHSANEGGFAALATDRAPAGASWFPAPGFPDAAARARADRSLDLGGPSHSQCRVRRLPVGTGARRRGGAHAGRRRGLPPPHGRRGGGRGRARRGRTGAAGQIDRALEAGVDVTHIDSHMGTMFHRGFFDVYLRSAATTGCPYSCSGTQGSEKTIEFEADGFPLFDGFCADSLGFSPGTGDQHNRDRIGRLMPGLNYLICHAAQAGIELSAITDDAHARDFERGFYGGRKRS